MNACTLFTLVLILSSILSFYSTCTIIYEVDRGLIYLWDRRPFSWCAKIGGCIGKEPSLGFKPKMRWCRDNKARLLSNSSRLYDKPRLALTYHTWLCSIWPGDVWLIYLWFYFLSKPCYICMKFFQVKMILLSRCCLVKPQIYQPFTLNAWTCQVVTT